MKTAEEFVSEIWKKGVWTPEDIVKSMREYGAQVCEEAAKIAEPYESGSYCRACGPYIAAAIRKMELT